MAAMTNKSCTSRYRIAAIASLLSFLAATEALAEGSQDRQAATPAAPQSLRRLSNYEYNRTIRDMFGFDFGIEGYIQKDNVAEGFTNISAVAFSSPDRIHGYMAASRVVAQAVLGLDDSLVLRQRRWEAREILERNPNRSWWTALGRFLNDFSNRVKEGQRDEVPPNLGMRRIRGSDGQRVQALELEERARFLLHHDFPIGAPYRVTVHGRAWRSAGRSTLKISIYGVPQPLWIELSPPSEGLKSYAADIIVPRGSRSIEFTVPAGQLALVSSVEVEGPLLTGPGSAHPKARLSCIEPADSGRDGARECAARTIRDLATRAFRSGAVSDSAVHALLGPFQSAFDGGMDFRNALSLSIEAVLVDPRFLYRIESPAASAVSSVSDYEFATRLSYFLWGSLPDEELLRIAARKGLVNSPDTVRAQVRRMVADARSDALVESFAFGWLGIHSLRNHVVDVKAFAGFDEELRQAMLTESELYLKAFLRENWPIRDLMDSNTLFLNEKLARHYGIENVRGPEFRRLESAPGNRRGLLTQGAVLTLTSQSHSTSVVKRGLWLLERILCSPVAEAPRNVPSLEESAKPGLTLRQQMESHRTNSNCRGCHDQIDPAGFSLENYDATGRWRTTDGVDPIDPSGMLRSAAGPLFFKDFGELRVLLKDDSRIPACATSKLMMYALGRSLNGEDKAALAEILAKTQTGGARIQDVLAEIALSAPFRNRAQ
jgi:hypothetical protein